MDIISKKLANDRFYAYSKGRFWAWDEERSIWKESRLMTQKYELNHEVDKLLTPEDFLTDPTFFQPLEDYEVDFLMKNALKDAQPGKSAPIVPVQPLPDAPATAEVAEQFGNAPGFNFGADDQTNALLLQDAQTFITGNMARIMAAKHAHDLTASHYKGSWGKWCAAVGISRDTGDNMVRVAEQFGNIQLEGKSILDVQPMKLLYAAAKPSTPEPVKQAVFSGDITTYKEYQELMAQLKAKEDELAKTQSDLDHEISRSDELLDEKGRLLRECDAAKKARKDAEERADTAEGQLDAATADVQGLTEQNARLHAEKEQAKKLVEAAEAREEEAWKMHDKAEKRAKAAEEALRHQPITTMVDEEETARRARKLFDDMTDELRTKNDQLGQENAALLRQLEEVKAANSYDPEADYNTVCSCLKSIDDLWEMAFPAFERLNREESHSTSDYAKAVANTILRNVARVESEREQRCGKEGKA